jgi:protein-S-isoprenylcysteine O-methyltransferase Ste14
MKLFLKNLLFTLLIFGTVAIYAPLLISQGRRVSPVSILLILGALLLAAGAGVYLWTVWDFATAGKGTPLPMDAPRKLVVRGLYRYVRNPMYLGVLLVILGWAGIFADGWLLIYALGVAIIIHIFVLLYEEPRLSHLFGAEYDAYHQSAGRWLPHLPIKK